MTLKEACKESLVILKQVMEEKLNATNVEVCHCYCGRSVSLSLSVLEASLLLWEISFTFVICSRSFIAIVGDQFHFRYLF